MEININEELVQENLNKSIDSAISNAFSDYNVTSVIRDKIADEIIAGALSAALSEAILQIDISKLAGALAAQISKTATSSVVCLIRESMVNIIYSLQGGESYSKDKEAKKEKIRLMIEK